MTHFLFRLDMAKDNDQFMKLRSEAIKPLCVYAGTPMKVGPGWIPDYVEVVVDPSQSTCQLTLIELEATEINARASCRKYLPESSAEIAKALVSYLDVVTAQCRSTADSRLQLLNDLRSEVAGRSTLTVHTAGALRSSALFIEDLPLNDQPVRLAVIVQSAAKLSQPFSFFGDRRLTRAESDGLLRAVRILHAVIMGRDHSGSTLKSWRNISRKPLEQDVTKAQSHYPHLHKFLSSKTEFGVRVDCDKLSGELAALWSGAQDDKFSSSRVVAIVNAFVPLVVTFPVHEPMQTIFTAAREVIRETAI